MNWLLCTPPLFHRLHHPAAMYSSVSQFWSLASSHLVIIAILRGVMALNNVASCCSLILTLRCAALFDTHTIAINAVQQSVRVYFGLKVRYTCLASTVCHFCTISRSTIDSRASRDMYSIFCRLKKNVRHSNEMFIC